MKYMILLMLGNLLFCFISCNRKTENQLQPATTNPALARGGGNGGNNNGGNSASIILSFLAGTASRLAATRPDSMLISFSSPVPAAGYTLTFTSSHPAVIPPASLHVAPGNHSVYAVLNSTAVPSARNVTITVSVNGESKSSTIKLFPLATNLPAPSLQGPGNGADFSLRRQVIFDWSDLNDAYYYELQISSDPSFTDIALDLGSQESTTVADYFYTQAAGTTGTRYWRVRGIDASWNAGAWSAARNFIINNS